MIETKATSKHLCECGCNQPTPIAQKTDSRRGQVKGEYMQYLPGHNSSKPKKATSLAVISPLAIIEKVESINEIDEQAIETIRKWNDEEAARFFTERMQWIEKHSKGIFLESGLISFEVERRELFRKVNDKNGNPYDSLDRWLAEAAPFSRSGAYASMKALKQLSDVSLIDLREMPQCNVKILSKLSSKARKNTIEIGGKKIPIIEAAKVSSEKEFLSKIEEQYPDQHIESKRAMNLKPEKSSRKEIDLAINCIMWAYDIETREQALEFGLNYFLESPCEVEGYQDTTFRLAYLGEHTKEQL